MKNKDKKGFWGEFKEFISRGSVIDMAVGIIIGSAFTAIINSLVNDIITPVIGCLIKGISFEEFKITLPSLMDMPPAEITYGVFIQTILNFLITAFAVFCMVKGINSVRRKKEKSEQPQSEETQQPSAELQILTEIRDLLKEKNEQ
ncbi:MAG: large-conductance mechanosensitive channel protein MscL [Firmicutes bacterium]|nr:large-conductance mechanosensitive channel protein MscL [Bacillota bacterium]